MGKKIERAFAKDKDKASSTSHEQNEDDPNKTPEPHVCTGHFQTDFTELCQRNQMVVIPPVVPRPHRPPSPTPQPPPEAEKGKGKGKDDKKNQPPPEPEPEPILDENGEPPEPPPKTYTTKDKFEYFKPCVQVEMDNPDKLDTVTEVWVKGWKIDDPMMNIFRQCFPTMDKLHTINFWRTGLTDETLGLLASFLPSCPNVKNLVLDNNPVQGESYHLLIREDSLLQNLSLRYNGVTDTGARLLGEALGSPKKSNTKLISLNLNGNRIGDVGAEHLAKGLRMNRTLLCLSLANNSIGDKGVKKFAEVVSRFILTHEEVVERRKLISEKGSPDRKSPPPSRRADSNRPGSVRSLSHADKTKGGKSAKGKGKDEKKEAVKDEKHDKAAGKSKKEPEKPAKKASVVAEAGKTLTKGKDKKTTKDKKQAPQELEQTEAAEVINPLMESVERIGDGQLLIPGNRTLITLNLARNKITEDGMEELLKAVQYQITLTSFSKSAGSGLMRLCVQKNTAGATNPSYKKLAEQIATRDPFYKPPAKSPDEESHHG